MNNRHENIYKYNKGMKHHNSVKFTEVDITGQDGLQYRQFFGSDRGSLDIEQWHRTRYVKIFNSWFNGRFINVFDGFRREITTWHDRVYKHSEQQI